jgi:hypothetical protein
MNNEIELTSNCVGFDSFKDYYNFDLSTTSYGSQYLILNISSLIDDTNPFLIIPKTNLDQITKMRNDHSIDKRFLVSYTPSTHLRLSFECLELLKESCKLFINRYVKQTTSLKSVDVIADEGITRPYLILSTKGIKFLLSDDYDQFESIRCGIMTNRTGFNSLRRVVYSLNVESIHLFETIKRPGYNTLVLDFLDVFTFKCAKNHTIENDYNYTIKLSIPNEALTISKFINLPFVDLIMDNTCLVFPKKLLISGKKSIELMAKWRFLPDSTDSFPIRVNFDAFYICFFADHFDIITKNNRTITIEPTRLILPFESQIIHDLAVSCAICHNYHDHFRQCRSSANKLSIGPNCIVNNKRFTWASILVKNFKDSANLVRSGSLSIIYAISKLCNVVPIKYSNKYSKIDPYLFMEAYKNYISSNLVKDIVSFEDFMKLFDSLDDIEQNKSFFVNVIGDDTKQIDIFASIYKTNSKSIIIDEPDKPFCYFGLHHNIKRFVFFLRKLSSIFLLPERCPIEILYDGLSLDGLVHINALLFIPNTMDYSDTHDEFFNCDKWQALKSIGACKDFYKSKTPLCDHNSNFIKRKCNHCTIISNYHCLALETIMKTCGLRFEDVIPIIIPRVERTDMIIPILVKPNGLKGDNLSIIVDELFKLDNTINIDSCTTPGILSFQMFKELYPSAATNKRKFSKHWQSYMTSDVVTIIFLRAPNLEIVRQAMLNARKTSNIEWTKNIVHSAENDDELDLFFSEILKLDQSTILEPLAYIDGTTAELANRKQSYKH